MFGWVSFDFHNDYFPQLKVLSLADIDGDYGCIEYCEVKNNVRELHEAEHLFECFGEIIAYGKFFKIADGHCDNIIVNGSKIVWIDLETAFHFFQDKIEGVHKLEETGLLVNAKPENMSLGIVTALQGGIIPRIALTSPTVIEDGTENMRLRYFSLINPICYSNRIYLHKNPCLPENFIKCIQSGFENKLRRLVKRKNQIIDFVKERFEKEMIVSRYLFQVTASYERHLKMLNHIISQRKGNILHQIRKEREMTLSEKEKKFSSFILGSEISDLCNGVIPYFYRNNESKSIYNSCGDSRENFFSSYLMEEISQHLESASLHDLESDLLFISQAIESTSNIRGWEDFVKKFNFPLYGYVASERAC